MTMKRESTVEGSVCKWARDNGLLVLKLGSPNDRGKPDRVFLSGGRTAFIEFKAKGKKPARLQWMWIKKLREAGFSASWCDNANEGIEFLRESFSL